MEIPELEDLPDTTDEEIAGSLAALRAVNRYLGGRYAALHDLKRLITRMPTLHQITLLDIATGSADIPAALVRWAKRHGLAVSVTAVDIKEQAVRLAREWNRNCPEVTLVQADALRLPYGPRSFDFVLCSEFLHHLAGEQVVRLLTRIDEIARYGFVVTDLRRNWLAYLGILILTRLFTQNRLVRYDGPISVLKAFTPEELRALAAAAGLKNTRLYLRPLFRMTLVGDRTGGLVPEISLLRAGETA
ncbi:MAG: methyltransferase domain-containing protein [Candidatus Tectomicrobia bacterium]|uniref:Methyltransferase domain-containing protein n=1 Tax=Tectimicrobiota bacterium TaxID=2528274 RepID=A0A932CPX2_UNCTE|nr:methyltransferase domain-containing protein [Candidatus Tectomicrobia bacterium]